MKNSGIPLHKLPRALQDQVAAALYHKPQANAATPRANPPEIGGRAALPVKTEAATAVFPFTIWLSYRVPSLNSLIGAGRWAKKREIVKAKEALAAALAVLPAWPRQGTARLHVVVTCFVIHIRDADNPCPKLLIDQLRYAGILRDDDRGHMALTVNPDVRVAKRKLEGTRVTIVEALP